MNDNNTFDGKYENFKLWTGSGWRRWVLKYFFGSLIPLFIPIFYKFDGVKEWVVSFLKENKGEVDSMSSVIAEIFKEEIAEAAAKAAEKAEFEGKEKNLIENIRSLMETVNFTAKQAMDALKIPADEQEKYFTLI